MSEINVSFSDATEATITSYFACPQDPGVWPNQGVMQSSDARWKTFYETLPANAAQFLPAPS